MKETFSTIIRKAIGNDNKKSDRLFMEIQETLNNIVDDHNTVNGNDAEQAKINGVSALL